MSDEGRVALVDDEGQVVLTYLEGSRSGQSWADLVQVAPGIAVETAAGLLLTRMPGWAASGSEPLATALVGRGASVLRHAHCMSWDLSTAGVEPEWAQVTLADGLRLASLPSDVGAVLRSHELAYPPSHPDHAMLSDPVALGHVLSGEWVGTVHGSASASVVDESGAVVAGAIITVKEGEPPYAGPWVADVWRVPDDRTRGLGAALLRRAAWELAADGYRSLGLAVTDANPARQVYERLGFVLVSSDVTVSLPPAT